MASNFETVSANNRLFELIQNLGKSTVNTLYPNEFEYYMIAFELVNYKGETIDYFSFPVMPKTLNEEDDSLVNIQKTLGGISIIKPTGFIPKQISIDGNFGKSFKALINNINVDFKAIHLSTSSGVFDDSGIETNVFSKTLKTGYGCFKVLESIMNKSKLSDYGFPRLLYFYNPALGNSYVVEYVNMRKVTNEMQSGIWSYSLQLRAVAPLNSIKPTTGLVADNPATTDAVQRFVNDSVKDLITNLENL